MLMLMALSPSSCGPAWRPRSVVLVATALLAGLADEHLQAIEPAPASQAWKEAEECSDFAWTRAMLK